VLKIRDSSIAPTGGSVGIDGRVWFSWGRSKTRMQTTRNRGDDYMDGYDLVSIWVKRQPGMDAHPGFNPVFDDEASRTVTLLVEQACDDLHQTARATSPEGRPVARHEL
jgi:hypothetical protein